MSDSKLTALSAIGSLTGDDLLYVVDDPSGTPVGKKATVQQFIDAFMPSIIQPQGRLTLTTAVPYLASTVTAATTIYYTPAVGKYVPLYDGSAWSLTAFTELSQATTDNTKSPAACGNNSNYDLFVWNDSNTIRCTRGPAWSSDTSRGSGGGTTEISLQNGVYVNTNAITNGPGALRGTYVGTVRTNGSAQVDMIFGGSGAAGGESSVLGIWNMYNRVPVVVQNFDNTDSWTYTTATIRIKNNNNANKIAFVIGVQGDSMEAANIIGGSNSTTNVAQSNGIGLNSTTALAVNCGSGVGRSSGVSTVHTSHSFLKQMAPLGYNYVAPLEHSTASGTSTWYGDNGGGTTLNSMFTLSTRF